MTVREFKNVFELSNEYYFDYEAKEFLPPEKVIDVHFLMECPDIQLDFDDDEKNVLDNEEVTAIDFSVLGDEKIVVAVFIYVKYNPAIEENF